jgi:hypothetical protein
MRCDEDAVDVRTDGVDAFALELVCARCDVDVCTLQLSLACLLCALVVSGALLLCDDDDDTTVDDDVGCLLGVVVDDVFASRDNVTGALVLLVAAVERAALGADVTDTCLSLVDDDKCRVASRALDALTVAAAAPFLLAPPALALVCDVCLVESLAVSRTASLAASSAFAFTHASVRTGTTSLSVRTASRAVSPRTTSPPLAAFTLVVAPSAVLLFTALSAGLCASVLPVARDVVRARSRDRERERDRRLLVERRDGERVCLRAQATM